MKKIYQTPSILVLEVLSHGVLCQTSGKYDADSINKEEEETLVKGYNYSGNAVQWDNWE